MERVQVIDFTGRQIFNEKLSNNNEQFNLSSFPNGLSQINIISGGKVIASEKVVKQ
ncbi:MAG: T9SS type A sorting domain-containing protein [Bacteroidales bacterium]|nr:T9SS type A sorting domain-containing protein [Bacteroidales bacterium]